MFLLLYAAVAVFAAARMVRLLVLLAPAVAAFAGILVGAIVEWSLLQLTGFMSGKRRQPHSNPEEVACTASNVEDEDRWLKLGLSVIMLIAVTWAGSTFYSYRCTGRVTV